MTDLFAPTNPEPLQLKWTLTNDGRGNFIAALPCSNSGWRLETFHGPQGYHCYVRRFANRRAYEADQHAAALWILGPYSTLNACQSDAEFYVGIRRNRIVVKNLNAELPQTSCPVSPAQILHWRQSIGDAGTLGKVKSWIG